MLSKVCFSCVCYTLPQQPHLKGISFEARTRAARFQRSLVNIYIYIYHTFYKAHINLFLNLANTAPKIPTPREDGTKLQKSLPSGYGGDVCSTWVISGKTHPSLPLPPRALGPLVFPALFFMFLTMRIYPPPCLASCQAAGVSNLPLALCLD